MQTNVNIGTIVDMFRVRDLIFKVSNPRYVVMSLDTFNLIIPAYKVTHKENYTTIFGVKVAICNSLKLGEFEVV